jgi:hypothetical protein
MPAASTAGLPVRFMADSVPAVRDCYGQLAIANTDRAKPVTFGD